MHIQSRTRIALAALGLLTACGSSETSTSSTSSSMGGAGNTSAAVTSGGTPTSTGSAQTGASSGSTGAGGMGRDYSNDPSKFFGASRCATAGVELCDGFETPTLDAATWTVNGATPTIDGTHAARGSTALHVHTLANGLSYIKETKTFPATGNAYWGRMFVWFDALPTAPDYAHWTIVGASGSDVPGEIRVSGQYYPNEQKNFFGVGTDGGATGDWNNRDGDNGPTTPPLQQWICVEWLHDTGNDETRFYWDADEHPSLRTSVTMHGGAQNQTYQLPQFNSVWVGWWLYQANPTPNHYDVWIDEVAIDKDRIGCIL